MKLKKQLKLFTATTQIWFLSAMVIGLLTWGCVQPHNSQSKKSPSTTPTSSLDPSPLSPEVKAIVQEVKINPPCLKRCSMDDHSFQGQCFMSDHVRWWGVHDYTKILPEADTLQIGVYNFYGIRLDNQTVNGAVCAYEIPHPSLRDIKHPDWWITN